MDFKFSKDMEEGSNKDGAGKKGNQSAQLILLLVLVGGFAYVYFFTGIIKPLDAQKPADVQVPQVIKKPIPSRDGGFLKVSSAASEKKNDQTTAPIPVKPEPPKVAQESPVVAPVAKEGPKPKEVPKKPEPAKTLVKKPLPAQAAKQEQKLAAAKDNDKKNVQVEKKTPVAAEKKDAAAKKTVDKKKTVAGEVKTAKNVPKSQKKAASVTGKAANGHWTVMVGSYLLEDALANDMVKVRKAGLEAAVLPGARKKTAMTRLLLGEYNDRAAAQAELAKIRRHTSDAFIMDQGDKHAVYAGSYLLHEGALSEKERLAAAGFPLTLKRTEVAIPSKILSAGTFNDKKAAESALKKLKAVGVKASLSQQ